MKILFIRSAAGISGAERYLEVLYSGLQRAEINAVILTNFCPWYERLKKNGFDVSYIYFPLPETGTLRTLVKAAIGFVYMIPAYLRKIIMLEKGEKFDTIVLSSITEKLFLSGYLKLLGYRVVWITHGPIFRSKISAFVKWLYVWKSRWPDAIIAVSKDTRRDLLKGGIDPKKVETVYIGSSTVGNIPLKQRKVWTIGFLGTVCKDKGIDTFLTVAEKLTVMKLPVRFLVIGAGPLLSWLKKEGKEKLRKRLSCTGYVEGAQKILQRVDILFSPTCYLEGLSLALLEALALGKVVVARDVGGNRELVIHKKTGFLFHTDEEALEILIKIIRGSLPVSRISENALLHIKKHFLLETQIPKFISIFTP